MKYEDEHIENNIFPIYDCDTALGCDNGHYFEPYEQWKNEHLKEIRSKTSMSPRGSWFWYASLYDGHIYAIGDEQGNYCGGDLCSVRDGEDKLREFIKDRLSTKNKDTYEGSLYEKIKDFPIASVEMYREMRKKIEEFEEQFKSF